MQDWNYRYLGCNEVTIELTTSKTPNASQLANLWNDNRESMLAYLEACHIGVAGIVKDRDTGDPIYAQVLVDGNEHLATFGALSGTAEESKRVFGKGLWKKLCHNTKSRNDLIVKAALPLSDPTTLFSIVRELNKIPSTLLKDTRFLPLIIHYGHIFEYSTALLAKYKTCKAITRALLTYTHNITITDTMRMLDGNINISWSIDTWDRRHKELVETRNQAMLGSKEIF